MIVLSALDAPCDKRKAFALGAVDYIAKPINRQELLARIATRLAQPTTLDTVADAIDMLTDEFTLVKQAASALIKEPSQGQALLTRAERRLAQRLLYYRLKKADLRLDMVELSQYFDQLSQQLYPLYQLDIRFKVKTKLSVAADRSLLGKLFSAVFAFNRQRRQSEHLPVELSVQGQNVIITVTDLATMLTEQQCAALFNPLALEQVVEHDLALANAAVIAQKHGGDIYCQSSPLDTVLTITLPRRLG